MSYSKLNDVNTTAITSVNGALKGSIASINGSTTPSAGVDNLWIAAGKDGAFGHVEETPGNPVTGWVGYRDPNTTTDYAYLAYGKDGSTNPRWVCTTSDGNRELRWSDDPETDGTWTDINISSGKIFAVSWSNDKWVGAGIMNSGAQTVLTSSDGATWNTVDISALADISTVSSKGIGTDGGNNWIFTQEDRLYASNNQGANWYLLKDFDDDRDCFDVRYSNARWFVWCTKAAGGGGASEVVAYADAASSGSWTSTADTLLGSNATDRHMMACVSTASAGLSTVIAINSDDIWRSTDSCASGARFINVLPYGSANSIAGDGAGNWVVVHNGGNISYSVDDGTTWSSGASALVFDSGTEDIQYVALNKYFPL